MAQFPTTEAEVVVLAEEMISGFTDNPLVYPAPPVAVIDLTTAMNAAVAAKAAAEAAVEAKDAALEALEDAMKSDIKYAEKTN